MHIINHSLIVRIWKIIPRMAEVQPFIPKNPVAQVLINHQTFYIEVPHLKTFDPLGPRCSVAASLKAVVAGYPGSFT